MSYGSKYKSQNIKLLKENTGENLSDLKSGKYFFNKTCTHTHTQNLEMIRETISIKQNLLKF